MSIWSKYDEKQREEYISFLKMYGSLSALFNQKSSETGAPYLDSKFQETIYARSFASQEVDIGNTPHDVCSTFEDGYKVGIGIKTFLNSSPSYQKVMQMKSSKQEIEKFNNENSKKELAKIIAVIKNNKLDADYGRLGLNEEGNIYHYVTRDKGKMIIQETSYPKIDISTLKVGKLTSSSFMFKDENKEYKYTFADSQVWMKFGTKEDTKILSEIDIDILSDPFDFLKNAFDEFQEKSADRQRNKNYTYLPLYSYKQKKVNFKSGINAFNGAPKTKNGFHRPIAEVYIPIPKDYWRKHPFWFNPKIDMRDYKKYKKDTGLSSYRFSLHLPNGKVYPALIGQQGFKALETDPQSALGEWLLYDVLKLSKGEIVTDEKLSEVGFDSVKLWRNDPLDYSNIWIDFAHTGSFEQYMEDELIEENE